MAARFTLNGSSFTPYGWTVCLWSLIVVFQVLTYARRALQHANTPIVWLSYLGSQPDSSRLDMQIHST